MFVTDVGTTPLTFSKTSLIPRAMRPMELRRWWPEFLVVFSVAVFRVFLLGKREVIGAMKKTSVICCV